MVEIVVMCGGLGLRMGKLSLGTQKCMLEVDGQPILRHLLEQISTAFDRATIILLVGYKSDSIRGYFGERYKNLRIKYATESMNGTREALLGAENLIETNNFVSIDGNMIVKGSELLTLSKSKKTGSIGVVLLSSRKEIALTHGLATVRGNKILKIYYPPTKAFIRGNSYRLMDAGFYSRALFGALRTHFFPTISEVLKIIIERGEIVNAKISSAPWLHFVAPEDLKKQIVF